MVRNIDEEKKREIQDRMAQAVESARRVNPLVGSVTNVVSIEFVANAQIAVGGSAAMVYLPEEAELLTRASNSAYINLGTLLPIHGEALPRMVDASHEMGTPWVLDPVGIGIGSLRAELLLRFKADKPDVIKGNASEILALAGLWELYGGSRGSSARGVDSTEPVMSAREAAISLASWTGGAVAVSGEVDLVTDGSTVALSHGGSHLMKRMTGSGCALGGVITAYSAVAPPFIAALTGTAIFNLAAGRAERRAEGPGSFMSSFIDELYKAEPCDVANGPFEFMEV